MCESAHKREKRYDVCVCVCVCVCMLTCNMCICVSQHTTGKISNINPNIPYAARVNMCRTWTATCSYEFAQLYPIFRWESCFATKHSSPQKIQPLSPVRREVLSSSGRATLCADCVRRTLCRITEFALSFLHCLVHWNYRPTRSCARVVNFVTSRAISTRLLRAQQRWSIKEISAHLDDFSMNATSLIHTLWKTSNWLYGWSLGASQLFTRLSTQ